MNRRNLLGLALLGSVTAGLAACGGGGDPLSSTSSSTTSGSADSSSVIIGSANFPESELIAEMYAQVLEGKGVKVERKFNIGARELYLKALDDGSIDLLPEYNGALLAYYLKGDAPQGVSSPEQVLDALKPKLPSGLEVLDQAAAEDKDSLSVSSDTASKYNLKSIADLAPVAKDLVAGGGPEFVKRYQGLVGLKELYGVEFKEFKSLDPGGPLTVGALKDGTIQVGNIFTTDSAITTNKFTVLEDPKNLFLAQNVLPLIRSSKSNDTIASALNAFSAKLTTENLTEYLSKVQVDKQDSATVAKAFLSANGLA
ncbi:ABC transporter substrate-binding protein [Kineococcus rhizosphaerae]|uniref:Osmoprotectant transport system substrate-binding protein n=1 Tax=Kineococcus rhizosphaerae TaxID=559628 RepID=A0A2T0QZA7_9ACTN|nr:ABC transporter substrate-binding protein [Kineococcus rhizosphaerae]PRY11786.1 osmoprotectant transport system substrate-binding protein [Kineococcus rhizosphaerae]